jgi:hypothetical protein
MQFGLPQEWVRRLVTLDPERRQVLRVRSTVALSDAAGKLQDGDMILAVGGRAVSGFVDVERAIEAHVAGQGAGAAGAGGEDSGVGKEGGMPPVSITLFREGRVEEVAVRLGFEDGLGTDRLVHWCGAQLQAPHRGVRELGFLPSEGHGVYISRWHHGSPAHRVRAWGSMQEGGEGEHALPGWAAGAI